MEILNVQEKYLPYLAVDHTRYIEAYVSVDNEMVSIGPVGFLYC